MIAMGIEKRRIVLLVLATGYSLLILALCLMPGENIPTASISHEDKLEHVVTFMLFGLLWMAASSTAKKRPWESIAVWAGGTAFGVLIELLQGWLTSDRHLDPADALADTIGLIIGIWGYHAMSRLLRIWRNRPQSIPIQQT